MLTRRSLLQSLSMGLVSLPNLSLAQKPKTVFSCITADSGYVVGVPQGVEIGYFSYNQETFFGVLGKYLGRKVQIKTTQYKNGEFVHENCVEFIPESITSTGPRLWCSVKGAIVQTTKTIIDSETRTPNNPSVLIELIVL